MKERIEFRPCSCGDRRIEIFCERDGDIWGVGIGCLNILCDNPPLMSFARTKEEALKIAIKNWNGGVDNEQS